MWMPTTAEEVETAVRAGEVEEGPSFDAKRGLPATPKKNDELAKDVAAMATDGGVILYGVEEDEDGRPTILTPIELDGAAERVALIVATSIAEVPYIETRALPRLEDPSKGYLLVIVPQSDRAPHQVTVGKDLRFYGRHDKTNRVLGEADVARLYERRARSHRDREEILATVIASSPYYEPQKTPAFVYAFVEPVAPDQGLWDRAERSVGDRRQLQRELSDALTRAVPFEYGPTLRSSGHQWMRRGADAWRISTSPYEPPRDPSELADLEINVDGRARAFNGRGSARLQDGTQVIFEELIAGTVAGLFALTAALYKRAGYHGHVDVGASITGLEDAYGGGSRGRFGYEGHTYAAERFTNTTRVSVAELAFVQDRTRGLLGRFFEASGGDGYDPFAV
jgi:hypothetical protein